MTQVRNETLEKLKCSSCKKYLSHFPIYFVSICGRCPRPESAVRNQLYEQAMTYSKFPCCFDFNGCIERLVPNDMPKHELWCKHRTLQCPTMDLDACNWRGLAKNLYSHFEKEHMIFILPNKSFELDFVNSHKENCLLNYGQDLYVVTRSADSKKNVYSCTINYIGSNPLCAEYYSKLTFKNVNGSKEYVVQKKIGDTVEIQKDEIRRLLEDPFSIVVDIDILDKEEMEKMDEDDGADSDYNMAINFEMMKELECIVSYLFYISIVRLNKKYLWAGSLGYF